MSITIISFCVMVLAIINFWLLQSYVIRQRIDTLTATADRVSEMLVNVNPDDGRSFNLFISLVTALAELNNAAVVLVDYQGGIIINSSTVSPDRTALADALAYDAPRIVRGDALYGVDCLTYVLPLKRGSATTGYCLVSVQYPALSTDLGSTLRLFSIALVISVPLAIVLSLIMSRSITKPIFALGKAAKSYARGQFERADVYTDIAELKQLATTYEEMRTALEQTEAVRRDFVANVSHDLRSPLTTVGGFLDLLQGGAIEPERYGEYFQIMRDEVTHMAYLVDCYLDINKYDSGNVPLNRSRVDLCELVRRAIIREEAALDASGRELEVELPDTPLYAELDEGAMGRVLSNLLGNAVKYAAADVSPIDVGIRTSGDTATVYVRNSGFIDPADVPHLFDRFYRCDKSRTRGGTGLGLFIARAIVRQHGSDLAVDVTDDTVTFCFDVAVKNITRSGRFEKTPEDPEAV